MRRLIAAFTALALAGAVFLCPAPAVAHPDLTIAAAASVAYGPTTIHHAYGLPWTSPVSQTIAIVDAGGDATIQSDLAAYNEHFELPPENLQIVNQRGGATLPASSGWEIEIALDVEMAHSMCLNCTILLVEADSATALDLETAVNTAAAMGATEISNSYGGSELGWDTTAFDHPGVAITASTGDDGYGVSAPASFPTVIAVGGTSLHVNSDGSYASETAWKGAGSGCSEVHPQQWFQKALTTGCSMRSVADVSAVADPNTGVWVISNGKWWRVGGTSVSSPLIAATIALAGGMAGVKNPASIAYKHAHSFHDVTSGSNGVCDGVSCNAGPGYDGPTGLGTPNGVDGFRLRHPRTP